MSEKMADDIIKGTKLIIGFIWLVKRFFSDRSIVLNIQNDHSNRIIYF